MMGLSKMSKRFSNLYARELYLFIYRMMHMYMWKYICKGFAVSSWTLGHSFISH